MTDRPDPQRADIACELRAFIGGGGDVAALLDNVERLMVAHGAMRVRRSVGARVARVDPADDDDIALPPPSAVVLLADAAGLDACGATMRRLRLDHPGVPLLVLELDVPCARWAEFIANGAFDFTSWPGREGEVGLRLRRALGLQGCDRLTADADDPIAGLDAAALRSLRAQLIGRSPAFLKVLRRVPVIAGSEASALLLGETGTGKEVCAQALHYCSQRARGPWVAINCAAIPAELVEDELFGHVRGAYTHALDARRGLVQEAEGGTLFLDEIDALPLRSQAKLLRFLQDKEYRSVGSSQTRTADVRVIAASNCDLRSAAARGEFRLDLYYRLNVLGLMLPPLRERRADIAPLARHFVEQASRQAARRFVGLTMPALRALEAHHWPGNVRELKHVLQRAVLLAQGPAIEAFDLEFDDSAHAQAPYEAAESFREAKARAVESFERQYLEQLLAQSGGNITRAARAAHKNRRAFFELMRRHAIDAARFRRGEAIPPS